MKKNKKKVSNISINKLFPILIFIITIFMGVGYASINSVLLNVSGDAIAKAQDGVFITEIKQEKTENSLDTEKVLINIANQTLVNSKITLDNTDVSSDVKLAITVYNSSTEDHVFVGTFYDDEFYDNNNITFDVSGVLIEDIIKPGDYLTFYVTFKYNKVDSLGNISNILNSSIDYRFEPYTVKETLSGIEFNYLMKNSTYSPEGDVYEYYSQDENRAVDNTVKIIVFGKTSEYKDEVSDLIAEPIDLYQTGSISMYRRTLSDDMYKIYILSDSGKFILNENAAWMFDKLYSLEYIVNLHLLDTSKVVNMRDMFCDCASIKSLDLSNFDTSNVTNMIGMFARMTELNYLDLSSFDTSNVTEMGQMFTDDPNLKRIYVSNKWDVSSKVAEANGGGVFTNNTNLVGGNGTVFDSTKVTYAMAKVDGTSAGYLTTGYKMNTGINVNHVIKNKSAAEIEGWTLSTRFVDTTVKTLTFGQMKDYNEIVSGYEGKAVDSDGSGVISVYRIPNGAKYDVYILSNSGKFEANADSSWLFDNLVLMEEIRNLKLLDTSNVSNMRDMFCDAQTITNLDLSNFNTMSATSFEGMFARTYNLEVIDISSFTTTNINTIKNMFVVSISSTETHANYMDMDPKLKTIYVSNKWDVSKLTSEGVFANAVNLVGGNGTVFDSTKVTTEYAVVDSETVEGYFTLK